MAILAVTNNLSLLHDCNSTTNTLGYALNEDNFKESSGSLSVDTDIETTTLQFTAAPADLENTNIYFWFMSLTPPFLDTWENGGISLQIEDIAGSISRWYIAGSDTYFGGWKRFVINTSTTPDIANGTVDFTDVDVVSISAKGIAKSKLSENTFVDYVQYSADGVGITVTDGDTGNKDFNEIVTLDDAAYAGILTQEGGVYFLNGAINFADETSESAYFADTDKLVVTENWYRTFTTTNRTSAESLVSTNFHQINVKGNATGTTEFQLGTKSGTQGISGCTLASPDAGSKIKMVNSLANIDVFKLYGTDFLDCNTFIQPDSATGVETLNCTWSACGLVDGGTGILKYSKFINSPSGAAALKLDNATNNTSDCKFIGCDLGVELSAASTYTFTNMEFS